MCITYAWIVSCRCLPWYYPEGSLLLIWNNHFIWLSVTVMEAFKKVTEIRIILIQRRVCSPTDQWRIILGLSSFYNIFVNGNEFCISYATNYCNELISPNIQAFCCQSFFRSMLPKRLIKSFIIKANLLKRICIELTCFIFR